LRNYVMQTEMAKASKVAGSDQAEKARAKLIESLIQSVAVTPSDELPAGEPGVWTAVGVWVALRAQR